MARRSGSFHAHRDRPRPPLGVDVIGSELAPDDPQRLGRYWLASRIGSGGQGVVYEAYDEDGTLVAVKMLRREVASGAKFRARFRKEAVAAQRVASFCTAKVLAVVPDVERPYLVSEFVPGPSLREAVRASGPLAGDDLLRLATGLATALTAIHGAGVVHRDLKPANVILGPDGPRVIDFGIAQTREMPLTETGSVLGSFGYMPLEVLSGQRAGAAADVFAWGAIMLFAATGEEPFAGEHIGEVLSRALEFEPDLDVLPGSLQPLVHEALTRDPQKRPDAAELLLRLLGTDGGADRHEALRAGVEAAAHLHAPHTGAFALGDAAAAAFDALPPAAQEAAREVCLRLVVPGTAADGSQDTVRTAGEQELVSGRPESEAEAVGVALAALAEAGVLVRDGNGVRPAGRALLRAWPLLQEWVRADREGVRVHRGLGEAARAWDAHGRRAEDVYRGTALRNALAWAATAPRHLRLNLLERQFLDASRTAEVRWTRQRRWLLSSAAVVLVLALVAGLTAWQQSRVNDREQARAEARRLVSVADGIRFADPRLARLLSVAAWRIAPVTESRGALIGAAEQKEGEIFSVPRTGRPFLSGNGRALLVVSMDRIVRWDVAAHRRTGTFRGPGVRIAEKAAASPDLRVLALPVHDRGGGQTAVRLWDVVRQRLLGRDLPVTDVWRMHFTGDGRTLAVTTLDIHGASHALLWDVSHRRPLLAGKAATSAPLATSVSPNGRYLVSCAYKPELWDVKRNTEVHLHWPERTDSRKACSGDGSLAFSPDSRRLSIALDDVVRTWDIPSRKQLPAIRHSAVVACTYSSDGTFMATASSDDIRLWRLPGPRHPVFRYPLANEFIGSLAVDAETGRIRYERAAGDRAGQIRSLVLGDAATRHWDRRETQLVRFSPDGQLMVTASGGRHQEHFGIRRLLDGKPVGTMPSIPFSRPERGYTAGVPQPEGGSVSFSEDARVIASGVVYNAPDTASRINVWDTARHRLSASLTFTPRGATGMLGYALSPDGKQLLTVMDGIGPGGGTDLYDVRPRKKIRTLPPLSPDSLAYRPDGAFLVGRQLGSPDQGSGLVVALPSGRITHQALSQDDMTSSVFSRDGTYLAVGDHSGHVTLWDGAVKHRLAVLPGTFTGTQLGLPEEVTALAFSPDDRILAVAGEEGTVRLWDVESDQPLGSALLTPGDRISSLAFDEHGTLHVASRHIPHLAYSLDSEDLVGQVCSQAGRGLSRDEWRTYVHNVPYRKVC
jgi:eukaryotic-like serine/threonine-protein kinase